MISHGNVKTKGSGKGKAKGKGEGGKAKSGKAKGGKPAAPAPTPPAKSGRGSSLTPAEKKKRACFLFHENRCTKTAKDCEYAHRKPTEDELKLYARMRARSPSPVPKAKECASFAKTKSCPLGDNCAFSHNTNAKAPPKAKSQ